MKLISLKTVSLAAPLAAAALAGYGCAPEDVTPADPVGGSGGSSTAGTPAVTGGSAGNPSSGGSNPTGGGGAGSTTAGTGGTGAGTGGTGDTGGSAGSPAGDPCEPPVADQAACINSVANAPSSFGNPGWKDSWWVTGCADKQNHDCLTIVSGCNAMDDNTEGTESKGSRTKEEWTLGGTPGAFYKVTFTYSGVNEGKEYSGGTKDVPQIPNDVLNREDNDSFYRDGTAPDSTYNVLKLSVFDNQGMKVRHYYMNAFSKAQEYHYTLRSLYTKSIVVVGGGKIVHLVQDKNCHAIDNCNNGEVSGTTCNSPRRLPGAYGDLMLPPKYPNPDNDYMLGDTPLISGGIPGASLAQPWRSQASHLAITAIEKTTDPPTTNYP